MRILTLEAVSEELLRRQPRNARPASGVCPFADIENCGSSILNSSCHYCHSAPEFFRQYLQHAKEVPGIDEIMEKEEAVRKKQLTESIDELKINDIAELVQDFLEKMMTAITGGYDFDESLDLSGLSDNDLKLLRALMTLEDALAEESDVAPRMDECLGQLKQAFAKLIKEQVIKA